jgi:hypothetical protein
VGTADGNVIGTTKIVDHGDPSQRWNLVILAEGYQAGQLDQFHADVQTFVKTMYLTAPYDQTWCGINIYRVDVSSTDSGAADPVACGGTGYSPHTYFDATFCGDGVIQRLLTVNEGTVHGVVNAQMPQAHMIMVIVNSTEYGGSGGGVATFSLAFGAEEIGLHETGHTAFGFADEYCYYQGCGIDTDRNNYAAGEPDQPNITTDSDRTTIKWGSLIAASTAMPTMTNPDCTQCNNGPNPVPPNTVGTFEGAGYYHCGLYRGQYACRMRALGNPYCAVCQQVIRQTLSPFMPTHTDNDLTGFANGTPAAAGSALDGYSASDNSQHINFIDGRGHVHELYRSPDPAAQWLDNDLTAFANGTPATADSPLDGYAQTGNSQHINFIDGSGHVHELYRSPNPAAQWLDNDLTASANGAPAVAGSAVDGYSASDNSQHVNFIDGFGHVHELYRSPDPAAQWLDNDLTAFANGTPAAAGSALDGYSASDNSQHINFVDGRGHVHELYRSPDPAAQWLDNDLTAFANGTPATADSPLDGYSASDNSQHINFIDGSGHVHELYRSPDPAAQWLDNDLTTFAFAGGTPAAAGSALDEYSQADNSQHVNFIDANGHVHELYRNPAAQWLDNDVTVCAGGTPAAAGSALDGYSQNDNSQHVNFIDANGHIHELYGSG